MICIFTEFSGSVEWEGGALTQTFSLKLVIQEVSVLLQTINIFAMNIYDHNFKTM